MSKKLIYVLITLFILIVAGGAAVYSLDKQKRSPSSQVSPPTTTATNLPVSSQTPTPLAAKTNWKEVGAAFAGSYADASVVTLSYGTYRMYAATQPEVAGNNLEVYSAKSTDGITWTKEAGTRKTMATFPQVIKLTDGTFRMYFQNAGAIKSATSKDGLTFTDESGSRIDKTNDQGMTFDNVAAPAVLQLSDGNFVMVYRGSLNEAYAAETVPNKTMNVLMWATSTDGKNWTKKGLAVDTRTSTDLKGWADGPELVNFDGEIRLYFSTYLGVYMSTFSNDTFSTPVFSWTLTNPKAMAGNSAAMAGMPPGDPTLLKIGSTWYMYYGRHPEGIYYATQQ